MKAKDYQKILQELSGIVDEGVHVVDARGKSIIYNEAMASLEKTNRQDVLGKPFQEAFAHIPPEESSLYRALTENRATINQHQTYRNKYGKEITAINSTIPVEVEGQVIAAIEIGKDITEIKSMSDTILKLQKESINPRRPDKPRIKHYSFQNLIGENKAFKEVVEKAKKAAKTDASVFIYGETGTGKELFAQSIHFAGERSDQPFLAQNCAALPESLLEGILFGTERGGFTGAVDRAGLFEQASGGTLLLDEISAMPYDLQSKLLRVLQEDYIRRVGGNKDIPIDVRIIATVNESPQSLIESGALRKDLYYRLNIVNITIPPLRERLDDLPLLVDSFLEKHNKRYGKEVWMASDGALEKLKNHSYPGNIRELENIIMSAVSLADKEHVLTEKQIQIQEAYHEASANTDFEPEKESMDQYLQRMERAIIKSSLAASNGNISRTAEKLGIKRQTLQHKLKKYEL
ncbi:sigma 54-interacting transcriptional regulator [Anaerovorax odorimutans]|uniref:Sigma 54-interacting transcriptional regulator n=1 Tax=Anaerovorax odorimutans TaxID=109327 RepID=A0ABT1RKG7_9FIRM|nr:sigma 54-interacting transcriptional regulator [Anaerovorax odorimutans]MCQ4635671.1 sigma 54-interacting transcriptional regulator [Anaerovorax odorimutans]